MGALLVAVLLASACGSSPDPEVSGATGPAGGSDTTTSSRRPTPGTAGILAEPAPTDGLDPATTAGPAPTDASPPEPAPAPTGSSEPAASTPAPGAPYPIGLTNLALVDASRPTTSRGATIAPSRSLPTVVAYPASGGGPWPLVVFAHGFRLGPPGYSRIVATMTAAGYVVAAPSFPLADEAVAGARVDRGDLPNQPGDVSFVIDQVLAASADPASPLAGRVDGSRVGAVGHSDGADTVLDLGYHASRSDPRVRAVVALSPDAVVAAGTGTGTTTPLLLEHGDADTVVPYTESVSVFAAVPARRYLLTLVGAGHLEPVTGTTAWTPVLDATVLAFLDRHLAGLGGGDEAITAPGTGSSAARIEVAG